MSYIIAHMKPDEVHGAVVELNPEVVQFFIGKVTVEQVAEVIESYCQPDPRSRTPDEEGRKLVQLSQFDYRVVNGAKYRAIRDQEAKRAANREAQARWRKAEKERKLQQKNTQPQEPSF